MFSWRGIFVVGLLVAALAPAAAHASTAQTSIIGGHSASITELPSLAYIEGEDAVTPTPAPGPSSPRG